MDPSAHAAQPDAAELRIGSRVLALRLGDITTVPADAIVNAANEALAGGGGVDGAIHRAAGPALMTELEERYGATRRCPTGQAVLTGAGRLPARSVIHAVGPVWRGGGHDEERLLASAYRSALVLATQSGAASVTLPAISCGIYGYPLGEGARVALRTVADGLSDPGTTVERATFVLFSAPTVDAFRRALEELRTVADSG
jgi:O-acetyl-ADP-ribose deacetylase (regulator of RNase III)